MALGLSWVQSPRFACGGAEQGPGCSHPAAGRAVPQVPLGCSSPLHPMCLKLGAKADGHGTRHSPCPAPHSPNSLGNPARNSRTGTGLAGHKPSPSAPPCTAHIPKMLGGGEKPRPCIEHLHLSLARSEIPVSHRELSTRPRGSPQATGDGHGGSEGMPASPWV